MQPIFLVLQVLVGVALIALVLLQQGRGADAGASFGGGGSGSLFGARGPQSFLAKMTGMLAAVFFINSLGLAYLATLSVERRSVTERIETAAPGGAGTGVPMAPESSSGNASTQAAETSAEGDGSTTVPDMAAPEASQSGGDGPAPLETSRDAPAPQ